MINRSDLTNWYNASMIGFNDLGSSDDAEVNEALDSAAKALMHLVSALDRAKARATIRRAEGEIRRAKAKLK